MTIERPLPEDPAAPEIARRATEERWADRCQEVDRTPVFPRDALASLARARWLGMSYPPELGGPGWPLQRVGRLLFELARWGGTLYSKLALQPEFCRVLAKGGTPALRAAYFAPLMRGELLVGNQITEPSAGSDVGAIELRAERRGSTYRLNGTKSQLAFAEDADAAIVYGHLDAGPEHARDLTAFLVPQRTDGVRRRLIEDHGERWMRRGTVEYTDVDVPAEHRLGDEHAAMTLLQEELTQERALLGAVYLGVAWSSWVETVERVGTRRAFGRPLADRQAVAFPLVEDRARMMAAGAWLDRLLGELGSGAERGADAALSKWYTAQVALEVVDHALQFHGAEGYSAALPHERRLRDLRSARLAHGTDEIMRLVAARALWPRSAPRPGPKH